MSTKPNNRSDQIIQQATLLFSESGYGKVTIKQIANCCGITDAALYRHFKSKEAIYSAVLESLEVRLVDQKVLDKLAQEKELEALLTKLAGHIINFFDRNADLYRLLLYSALEGHEQASRVFGVIRGRYIRFLVNQLDRLFDDGKIIKKNNEITARCFIGMVIDCAMGFSLWKGMQGKMYKASEVIANNIPIYVNGLKK
jgi:AcrR family transcriptional regulator